MYKRQEQQREFIVKDNVGFGEWDWEELKLEWADEPLADWGLDVWEAPVEADYSLLEGSDDIDGRIKDMEAGVKKAIQIEFEAEHYEEAYELVKFWRTQGDVGYMILDFLRAEKSKL